MKKHQRVVWTKGMFLNPQHFQTQDAYFEDVSQFRFTASNYANWGVTALEVDQEALANGLVRLVEARGIMPDGLAFRMPDADELPPSREIGEFFQSVDRELDVYLAIPEDRQEAASVTLPSASTSSVANTRFTAEERMVADVNAGVEKKAVQVARKNFRLLFGSESRDGFTCMRIAQIVRSAAGLCILKPTHIAPCLDMGHNQYLMGLLQRLVEILATKRASLSATRQERGKGLADFTAAETANFWLLHTTNLFLPELRHIRKVRHGHPEMAYLAMARLAGALSTFSLNIGPDDLPDYDHNDLGRCFTALDDQIRLLVDTIIKEPYLVIPLTAKERRVWTGTVPDDHFFRDSQFYLAVSAAMDTGELIQKIPSRVKAASPDEIDRLINKALDGITLTHVLAPTAVRMKLGSQYFEFSQNGDMWQKVQLSRGIAIFAPSDIKDPKMELIIVKNKTD